MSSIFSATLRWWFATVSVSMPLADLRITSIWRQPKRAKESRIGTGVPSYLTSAWSARPSLRPSMLTCTSPESLIFGK